MVVSHEFHYCSMLTIVAALGAGEAPSAHAHAVLCCISCVYLSASLLGSSAFDLDNRLKSDDCNTSALNHHV